MKHSNYDIVANITIIKADAEMYKDFYTLRYNNKGEEWELFGTKEEILNELSEHMDNMGEE